MANNYEGLLRMLSSYRCWFCDGTGVRILVKCPHCENTGLRFIEVLINSLAAYHERALEVHTNEELL